MAMAVRLSALVLCALAPGALAQNELRARGHFEVVHQFSGNTESASYNADQASATAQQVGISLVDTQQYVNSSIAASASWGALRYRAVADSLVPGASRYSTRGGPPEFRMTGSASFNEQVVVNAPGVAMGTAGNAVVAFSFHGGISTDDNGTAGSFRNSEGHMGLRLDLSVNGAAAAREHRMSYDVIFGERRYFRFNEFGQVGLPVTVNSPPAFSFGDEMTVPFTFTFGVPFEVNAMLSQTYGNAFSGNVAGNGLSITGDALNTASWGGFTSLSLSDGTSVDDFTAIGLTSGTSYVSAVPEPVGSGIVLVCGMAALATRRVRRLQPRCA